VLLPGRSLTSGRQGRKDAAQHAAVTQPAIDQKKTGRQRCRPVIF
jgi:hypothetical protein